MASSPPPYLRSALDAVRSGNLQLAREHAEHALGEHSHDPVLRHLLGVICCRAGDLERGIENLRAALACQPENHDVRIALATALLDKGWLEESRDIAKSGSHPQLAYLALETSRRLRDADGEASALKQLIDFRPDDGQLRRAHGLACAAAGNSDAAVESLDFAIQLDPVVVETRIELANLLSEINELQTALSVFDDAETSWPENVDLIAGKARLHVKLRHFDEAETGYRKALTIAPGRSELTQEFGLLLERTGRADEVASQIDLAVTAGAPRSDFSLLDGMLAYRQGAYDTALELAARSPKDDEVRRLRLTAKIHEARDDMAKAFDAAEAMNRAAPDYESWRERGARARAEIRRLSATTTTEWVRKLPPPLTATPRSPVFLVGFPRSGTTLLDTFLMGHPDVVVLEEEPILESAKAVIGDLAHLPTLDAATMERARDAYLAAVEERVGPNSTRLVIDKMPFNMLGGALIGQLFPGAPIIFSQRHPCDVVLSGFMQSFRLNDGMASFLDLDDAADLYDASMSLWTASRTLLPLNVHDLIYERLVESPSDNLRAVIAFLGLSWDTDLLDHVATAKKRGTIITPSYDQVTQPISVKPVGRWRTVEASLRSILPVLLPWAKKLGYAE